MRFMSAMPLACISAATDVPCRTAIRWRVSPGWMTYVEAAAGCGAGCGAGWDTGCCEPDAPGMISVCPTYSSDGLPMRLACRMLDIGTPYFTAICERYSPRCTTWRTAG